MASPNELSFLPDDYLERKAQRRIARMLEKALPQHAQRRLHRRAQPGVRIATHVGTQRSSGDLSSDTHAEHHRPLGPTRANIARFDHRIFATLFARAPRRLLQRLPPLAAKPAKPGKCSHDLAFHQ